MGAIRPKTQTARGDDGDTPTGSARRDATDGESDPSEAGVGDARSGGARNRAQSEAVSRGARSGAKFDGVRDARSGGELKGARSEAGSQDTRLGAEFFERSVHEVAPRLVGCRLFFAGVGGVVVETEAYDREDPASHSFVGFTDRTSIMFGPPGRAYVYLSYGIHSLLNVSCEPEGEASAVLIRALEPTAGIETMRKRRSAARTDFDLCSGPGKLTEALGITLAENGDLLDRYPFLLLGPEGDPPEVVTSPRVGITKAVERPWRFSAAGNRYVSRPRPGG